MNAKKRISSSSHSLHTIQLRSEFSDDAIAELQAEDSEIGKAYEVMSENLDPTTDEFRALPLESRRLLSMQPEVRLQDNLLVKERDGRIQVVVPVTLRKLFFEITPTQHISDHVAPTNS